jgi:glycosyltransferase involved in cell wall biosynthesis
VKVGIDGRSLVGGGARGVAHYTGALLRELAVAFPDDEWRVLLPRGSAVEPLPAGLTTVRHPLPGRVLFGAAALTGRPRLDQLLGGDCDVVWAPAPAPLALRRHTPFVLTVHDRSWEQRPADFTAYERAWHRLARPRRLAARARVVVCDAEAVRRDLIEAWRLEPAKVRAVPLAPADIEPDSRATDRTDSRATAKADSPTAAGADPRAAAGADSHAAARTGPRPTTQPYFLFVGALEPRKAPDLLVEAYTRARRRGLDAELVLAGEGRLAPRLAAPGVEVVGRVDGRRLRELYVGAIALVLPSWLEGFGLTPVEALAHGTPAIVSDLPVLREVLEDGALYVPPGDVDALAGALLDLAGDGELRARFVIAGQAATAHLSWAETARRMRAILAEAAA